MLPTQKLLRAMKGYVKQGRQVARRSAAGQPAKSAVRTLMNLEPVIPTGGLTGMTGGNKGYNPISQRDFIDQADRNKATLYPNVAQIARPVNKAMNPLPGGELLAALNKTPLGVYQWIVAGPSLVADFKTMYHKHPETVTYLRRSCKVEAKGNQYSVVWAETAFSTQAVELYDIDAEKVHDDRLCKGGSYYGADFSVDELFFGTLESALDYAEERISDVPDEDKRYAKKDASWWNISNEALQQTLKRHLRELDFSKDLLYRMDDFNPNGKGLNNGAIYEMLRVCQLSRSMVTHLYDQVLAEGSRVKRPSDADLQRAIGLTVFSHRFGIPMSVMLKIPFSDNARVHKRVIPPIPFPIFQRELLEPLN